MMFGRQSSGRQLQTAHGHFFGDEITERWCPSGLQQSRPFVECFRAQQRGRRLSIMRPAPTTKIARCSCCCPTSQRRGGAGLFGLWSRSSS